MKINEDKGRMFRRLLFFGMLALLLLSSCKEESTMPDAPMRLNISFADDQTRSSWNDNTDTGGGKVSYVWDNSNNNMLTAIKHDNQYVPFYVSLSSAAQYHTPTKFETVDDAKSKIKLQTTLGVKYDVQDNAYVYPVAADDAMYCCHPINEERATIHSTPDAVQVDFSLPSPLAIKKTPFPRLPTIPTYIPPPRSSRWMTTPSLPMPRISTPPAPSSASTSPTTSLPTSSSRA